jgi:hypothetical protein
MLAKRLTRHGLEISGGALAAVLSQQAAPASVPTLAISSTIKAASLFAAGQAVAGVISINVAVLTEGVLKTMLITKLKVATVVLLTACMIGLSSTFMIYRTQASDQGSATNDTAKKTTAQDREKKARAAKEPSGNSADQGNVEDKPAANGQRGGQEKEKKVNLLEDQGRKPSKLQTLLKERLEILQRRAEKMKSLRKVNAVSEEEVWQANLRLCKAELDLCETARDRIAVLEKIATICKQKEEHIAQLVKQRSVAFAAVDDAHLERLEAEIALEREKAKSAGLSK